MASLGTLTLNLRATRNLLALDLLQSQQEIERFEQSVNKSLSIKTRVSIDWDSLSRAESEIRRWVDSLPHADLTVRAKLDKIGLQGNLKDLERLLNNPLKILVDDKRLFELNEHFRLKERDYQHLQSILNTPLTVKVDRTQLDNLSRSLQSIESTPQVNLKANVDLHSLRKFHEQLKAYSQSRTIELATSVSRSTLNSLQKDLRDLSNTLTTARVSVQIDSQLQALRSELGSLPNVTVGVTIDDSDLAAFDRKLGDRKLGLGIDSRDIRNIDGHIDRLGKKLDKLKPANGIFKAVTFAPTQVATGFFQGIGQSLSSGLGAGYRQGIDAVLGDTIGSTELLGRKLAESIANRTKSAISQLVPTAITDALKKSINESLGEADVFIESRSKQAIQSKRQRKKKAQARDGVAEERRQATRDYEDWSAVVTVQTGEAEKLERIYKAKKRVKDIVDAKIETRTPGTRSRAKLEAVSDSLDADLGVINQEQLKAGKALQRSQNALEKSERRVLRADKIYQELKPTTLPKVYREAIADVPEHLVPELKMDRTLAQRGASATYTAKSNRIKVDPLLYAAIQSGDMGQDDFRVMYHDLEHGRDFKFGEFQGLVDLDNLEIQNPIKPTAQELKDIAPFISQYKPELRNVEQNAEIAGRRAATKLHDEQLKQAQISRLTSKYGLGGIQLESDFNSEVKNAGIRTLEINHLGEQSGVSSPSAGKIIDRSIELRSRQKEIGLDIAKASAGELNSSEIFQLEGRIYDQIASVQHLSDRIDALKKSIIKRINAAQQAASQPAPEPTDVHPAPLNIPASQPEYEYVETHSKPLELSAHVIGSSDNHTPLNIPDRPQEPKHVEIAPPKLITQITETEAIDRAKQLAKNFQTAQKAIKAALKKGELELAFGMAQELESFAGDATSEIANITSLLGDKAAFGTTLGAQLANAKGQITRARNAGTRATTVYQNSNLAPLAGDELASLKMPTPGDIRDVITRKLTEFRNIFGGKSKPNPPTIEEDKPSHPIPAPTGSKQQGKNLGSPTPPPEKFIDESTANSFNPTDLINSIEQKLKRFGNLYPQAEKQVNESERRGRKNTKKFLRSAKDHEDLFDSSFDRLDRESAQNLKDQTAKTQNLHDHVFTENGITPLGKDIDNVLPKLSDLKAMGAKVLSVFAGFAGLAFAGKMIADWGNAAFQTASKMESLKTTMGAVTSSSYKAQNLIARSTNESNQLGYNAFKGIENDAAFYASTKGTALENVAPDLMTGLKQYNRVMGVSEERAQLSQIAIQQIAGKGKIAAEELFGQLAESSPGAVNVIARSQGITVGQLRKQMEEGGLNSNDVLPRFGNQLTAESMGGVEAASKSGAASVGRLQNSFQSLQGTLGERLMAPTIVGLEATTAASNTLKDNIDTLGKIFAASLLSAAASAITLSGGLSRALGFLVKNLTLAIPLFKSFAVNTIAAYGAVEVFSTIANNFNDSSPFKKIADDAEEAFARIRKGADLSTESIDNLKKNRYSEGRTPIQAFADEIITAFGGEKSLRSEYGWKTSYDKKADDDTINVDRLLSENQKVLNRKPFGLGKVNTDRRDEIDLQLSIVRAQKASYTSKDRDKIDIADKKERDLIEERTKLEKPNQERQAELELVIKGSKSIIDDPVRSASEKAAAKTQLAEAEKEQRKLQSQLVSAASTLALGLRNIGEGLQAGLAAIDLASINRKTQTYLTAAQDPRNTGGLAQANYINTNTDLIAKKSLQQQAVSSLKSTIYTPENRSVIQALGIDPEKTSQEQIDRLKSIATDTRSQSLLGYLSKYQTVKTELAQTNQSLFENQYNYVKSLADYNKGSIDQINSLRNRLANLSLTARSAIASLQQQVEQTLVEIDTTSSKAAFQAQRNGIQAAYNKFLSKLGISTDDIFEQIFTNYNSILDTVQQLTEARLGRKSNAITANYRQVGNETRKYQTQTEQRQGIEELNRQESERRNANPTNQLNSRANQTLNTNPANSDTNLIKPIASSAISSGYGMRKHPITGKEKFHEGTDYPVPVGTSVKAAGEGVVTFAGTKGGYGYAVDVQHSSGETTRYAHLSQIDVAVGQRVTQGQTIALSGGAKGAVGSGTSTGAHLHFETRNAKGEPISPEQRLKHNNIAPPVNTQTHDTTPGGSTLPIHQVAGLRVIAQGEVSNPDDISGYYEGQGGNKMNPAAFATGFPATPKGRGNIGRYQLRRIDWEDARKLDPTIPNDFLPPTQDKVALAKLYRMNRGGKELDRYAANPTPENFKQFTRQSSKEWESKLPSFMAQQGQSYSSLENIYRRIATTNPAAQPSQSPPVGKGALGEAILNNIYQQGVDEDINKNEKVSNQYVKQISQLSDRDTTLTKKKLTQDNNLSNQQDINNRNKLDTQLLQHQNLLNRNIPQFNRRSIQLTNQAAAYNRSSNNRDPYKQIDSTYQQYGGIPETATQDTAITDAQLAIEKITEESRIRREDILKQIQAIESHGAGWDALRKQLQQQIKNAKKNGFTDVALRLEKTVSDNDKSLGTPETRQEIINGLSRQYHALPSDGIAVADAISPSISKTLTDNRNLITQYAPKSFGDDLQAEARSIIEKFKSAKEALQPEKYKLDGAINILEAEIQTKFKEAGYGTQKLDLTNPDRLELMRKIAPEQTTLLEQKTAQRLQLNLSGQSLDRNAKTAADRSISIGKKREQLNVDRLNTDYLATTQDGNLFAQVEIDKQRYTQGKTDLDLEFPKLDASNIDLYNAKLAKLTLETNTLRNAILPLRGATTGFFDDIFKGQGILDGLGNALKNFAVNILKNFQDIISRHLGQQLFGSLATGADDLQGSLTAGDEKNSLLAQLLQSIGLIKPGAKSRRMDISLNQPILSPDQPAGDNQLTKPLAGMGLNLGLSLLGLPSIPGFATGGVVSSPTVALVGEGIHNEAIVPLPNGRSIPVDLQGTNQPSSNGAINNAISVTIQNSGQVKETSRGDSLAIANLIQNLVTQELINQRRPGGLLS